jgi:hypothetical protein
MTENKTIWLKNTTNKMLYEIAEVELSIYQTDPNKVVIATEAEVKRWKDGTYWANVNDVEVKPITEPTKTK